MSYSIESITLSVGVTETPIHAALFRRTQPPTVFTLYTDNGSGGARSKDLRVMGGRFPVSYSRRARHGETAAQGHRFKPGKAEDTRWVWNHINQFGFRRASVVIPFANFSMNVQRQLS